jgi:hypothetical protein
VIPRSEELIPQRHECFSGALKTVPLCILEHVPYGNGMQSKRAVTHIYLRWSHIELKRRLYKMHRRSLTQWFSSQLATGCLSLRIWIEVVTQTWRALSGSIQGWEPFRVTRIFLVFCLKPSPRRILSRHILYWKYALGISKMRDGLSSLYCHFISCNVKTSDITCIQYTTGKRINKPGSDSRALMRHYELSVVVDLRPAALTTTN